MDQQHEHKDQQQGQEKRPTLDELLQAFREGGNERVGLLMLRMDGKKMVPSPADLFLAHQKGGKEFMGALMANMDGDDDGDDRDWSGRGWR
jgi:hypothetical protein